MNLINPKPTTFKVVLNTFKKEHNILTGSNPYALLSLNKTNKNFKNWIEAELPKETLLKVLLPHHIHGKKEHILNLLNLTKKLINKEGATVEEAFKKLNTSKRYKCHKTIKYLLKQEPKHVFLSDGKPNDLPDYKNMKLRKGHLVHIDGFHRLLAALHPKEYTPVKCFIAVNGVV